MSKYKLGSAREATNPADLQRFLNPHIAVLEQVGSREIEPELEARRSRGQTVIPVYGYPVVPVPPHVQQAVAEAADSTFSPPSHGLQELRESLARSLNSQYAVQIDPEKELLVTSGAMNALHIVLTALLQPSDEVLLVSPGYFFGGLVSMTGARPVYVEMDEANGYAQDFDRIRDHISSRTKAIVLSSPVNPTGYVYTREDVQQFLELADEYDLLLISDESYDRMIYDGLRHIGPLSFAEGKARTILVKSFTKSFALPMIRVGYIAAEAALISCFRKVLEWTVLHNAYLNQKAALAALDGPQDWLTQIFKEFEARRNQVMEGVRDLPAFSCLTPHGGPFIFPNVSSRSSDCAEYARYLLHNFGIPALGGKYFHTRNHVRIPFGGTEEAVASLVSALAQAAEDLNP
jgi:aminotransferase